MKEAKGTLLMLGGVVALLLVLTFLTKTNNIIGLPNFGMNQPTPIASGNGLKTATIGGKTVDIVVANNDELRSKGLGGVTSLPENQGMLFVFSTTDITPSFWMKNMLIPIDFIWINDNKVSEITPNAQPPVVGTPDNQLQIYKPFSPVDYILEVNAGFAARNNILVGDSVILNF